MNNTDDVRIVVCSNCKTRFININNKCSKCLEPIKINHADIADIAIHEIDNVDLIHTNTEEDDYGELDKVELLDKDIIDDNFIVDDINTNDNFEEESIE